MSNFKSISPRQLESNSDSQTCSSSHDDSPSTSTCTSGSERGAALIKSYSNLKTFRDDQTEEILIEMWGHKYSIDSTTSFPEHKCDEKEICCSERNSTDTDDSVNCNCGSHKFPKNIIENKQDSKGIPVCSGHFVAYTPNSLCHMKSRTEEGLKQCTVNQSCLSSSQIPLVETSLKFSDQIRLLTDGHLRLSSPTSEKTSSSNTVFSCPAIEGLSFNAKPSTSSVKPFPLSPTCANATEMNNQLVRCPTLQGQMLIPLILQSEQQRGVQIQTERKTCRLWEYIRNLLLDSTTNPSLICWEDSAQGIFRLVEPRRIAYDWGMKKGNPNMTYEKFSRAMRYYYKREVFAPVPGRKHCYKFGPKASGWRRY